VPRVDAGYIFADEVTAAIDRYSGEVADAVVEKAQKLCTLYSKVLSIDKLFFSSAQADS
jgi:hypothetical protein